MSVRETKRYRATHPLEKSRQLNPYRPAGAGSGSEGKSLRSIARAGAIQKAIEARNPNKLPYGGFRDTRGVSTQPDHSARAVAIHLATSPKKSTSAPQKLVGMAIGGSTREIRKALAENHLRATQVNPQWRLWQSGYGSLRKEQVRGTFG